MRKLFRIAILITLLTAIISPTLSQETADGVFCVRSFEDTNGNGMMDVNEPILQGGVSANLMDANGVVVASALLDSSPQRTRGLICFQQLTPGQYTIEVFSGDLEATTSTTLTDVVVAGEVREPMDFGGTRLNTISNIATEVDPAVSVEEALPRIALSLIGAAIAMLVMSVLGLLIYLTVYRPRLKRAAASPAEDYYRRPSVTDTAEVRKQ
jgi:hypothetical protein